MTHVLSRGQMVLSAFVYQEILEENDEDAAMLHIGNGGSTIA